MLGLFLTDTMYALHTVLLTKMTSLNLNIIPIAQPSNLYIVATTKPMFNSSTSNKSQGRISSREHKLCNSQENSTGNHNSILPTIYIKSS